MRAAGSSTCSCRARTPVWRAGRRAPCRVQPAVLACVARRRHPAAGWRRRVHGRPVRPARSPLSHFPPRSAGGRTTAALAPEREARVIRVAATGQRPARTRGRSRRSRRCAPARRWPAKLTAVALRLALAMLLARGHDTSTAAKEAPGVHYRPPTEHGGGAAMARQVACRRGSCGARHRSAHRRRHARPARGPRRRARPRRPRLRGPRINLTSSRRLPSPGGMMNT